MSRAWAIVLAAGSGTRFGTALDGRSKVMAPVAGRAMFSWAVEAARAACDGVTLVAERSAATAGSAVGAGRRAAWLGELGVDAGVDAGVDVIVAGGATRSASVRAGLGTVPGDVDVVVCHDAARPGASAELFAAVIAAVHSGADAAVPVLAVGDTLKRVSELGDAGGVVVGTVDRAGLFAVQTPQAFRREALAAAHAGEPEATDDAGLIEAAGGRVVAIAGEAAAHKVTRPADLTIVEALLCDRAGGNRP